LNGKHYEIDDVQDAAAFFPTESGSVFPPPNRPDRLRAPGWTDRGDMASQQRSAAENVTWKQLQNNPDLAQKVPQEREQQQAARGNEGPEHDPTGGRERRERATLKSL
jgi:hypothetical protein